MSQDPVAMAADKPKLYSSTMLMAAGTIVSRALGAVRVILAGLILLNSSRQADIFNQASSIPSTVYMLLAGGILNAILVPQLMRSMNRDADGGQAFSDRIVTLFGLLVAGLTVILVVATPVILRIMVPDVWRESVQASQYHSMLILTAFCLPQVFFFGMFFLGGQILNARGSFGPLMWAPALNNVIQVIMLGAYAAIWGFNENAIQGGVAFTSPQILVLGIGSVFGVLCQALILIPFLKKVGFTYRPRFDFLHTGLGSTANMAKWVLALVAIDQVLVVIVNRLLMLATAGGEGAGSTVFNNAMLISLVPHAVFTVSLATALLPSLSSLAAREQWERYCTQFLSGIRTIYVAIVPMAVLLAVMGVRVCHLIWSADGVYVGWTLAILGIGLIPSTLRFLTVKAFNAMENTRTPFLVEIVFVAVTCLVSVVLVLLVKVPDGWIAPSVGLGYTLGYLSCGVLVWLLLRRTVPGIDAIAPYTFKLIGISLPGGLLAWGIIWLQSHFLPGTIMGWLGLVIAGCTGIGVYWGLAKLTHTTEIIDLEQTIRAQLQRGRSKEAEVDNHDLPDSYPDSEETEPTSPGLAGFFDQDAQPILTGLAPLVTGALLAGRYRLSEMVARIGVASRWSGFDEGLSRPVFITAFPNDENAARYLEAARMASGAMNARFWRILDAGQDADGAYVISERAQSYTLASVLQAGPLSSEESAWVVREVASALTSIHAGQLFHCRIDPTEIYITTDGAIKIAGLGIDQALTPRTNDDQLSIQEREAIDVVTCGGLLYACLTATWPGGSKTGLPASPRNQAGLQSPAQVQPGTSLALDRLTYQIMSIHDPGHIRTSRGIEEALTTILGPCDPQASLASRASANRVAVEPQPFPTKIDQTVIVESPTQEAEPAYIPEPPEQQSIRKIRLAPNKARQWSRILVVLVGLVALTIVTVVIVGFYNSDRRLDDDSGTSTASPPAQLTTYPISKARIFDPKQDGGSASENQDIVGLAFDDDPETSWTTEDYQEPIIPTKKPGVGVVFDLGEVVNVSQVQLTISLMPVNVMIYAPGGDAATVTKPDMSSVYQWTPLGGAVLSEATNTIEFQSVSTRYVLVYFTKLAEIGDGVTQADIAEVAFAG